MREALAEAEAASRVGEVPVGCVIVDATGCLLARGQNRRERDGDPTAHAEIVALRAAAQKLGQWRLEGTSLYVTLEPCPMCAGALLNARVSRLCFGAWDPKAGAVKSLLELGSDPRFNHRFAVTPGCLAEESVALLQSFFARLRAAGEK